MAFRRLQLVLWASRKVIGGNVRSQTAAREVLLCIASTCEVSDYYQHKYLAYIPHKRSATPEIVKHTGMSSRRVGAAIRLLLDSGIVRRSWDGALQLKSVEFDGNGPPVRNHIVVVNHEQPLAQIK